MQPDFTPLLDPARPLFLHKLALSPGLRVLVLAPHPDDFDLIGMTMRMLHDNGNAIDLVVLTSGASGVDDEAAGPLSPQDKGLLREEEQRASCRFFGLPPDRLCFLRLDEDAEGHMEVSEANQARVQAYWDAHSPDLVFLPHGNDTNAAHRRTYRMFRQLMDRDTRGVMAFLSQDPKTIGLRADLYTVFGEPEAGWKGALLRHHRTQHERNLRTRQYGIDERILRTNRQAAEPLGLDIQYAEAFELEWHAPR